MKERIDYLLNNYLLDMNKKVDSNKEYYKKFIKEIPSILYEFFDHDKYLIKASCGNGQKSEIPWICIFNKKVTTSATQGIYICYLFKKDMSGFYLVLGQGITTFERLYKSNKYTYIKKVAQYFQNLINDTSFSMDNISLEGKTKLSKGYEYGTILSKFYAKESYTQQELLIDLNKIKKKYDDICYNLENTSYMKIVENVISDMDPSFIIAQDASKLIEEVILKECNSEKVEIATLELTNIPEAKSKNKYSKISRKIIKKTDYLKKTIKDADNGLIGESLVMMHETEKLILAGRQDLVDKIRWVSKEDDGSGYDIISYDVDESGNEREIYIEVKSTEGKEDSVFFISKKELDVMEKLNKDYFIYRVYEVKTKNPKFFIVDYLDFKNKFNIVEESYKVNLIEN